MGDTFFDADDRWMVPNDRQLALRGRLETGWSSYGGKNIRHHTKFNISDEEQELILEVLQKNEVIQMQEQQRIGKLIKRLGHMKESILGDGISTCLICGTKAGYLKDQLHFCGSCGEMVCTKCTMDVRVQYGGYGKCKLCVLCNEDKMLWRRSGAWFYNAIPVYDVPGHNNNEAYRDETGHDSHGRLPESPTSPPQFRKTLSYVDFQRSQGSLEGSDDSDIENSSTIPEDKMSVTHLCIDTDEDSHSMKSFSTTPDAKLGRTGSVLSNSSSSADMLTQSSSTVHEEKNYCLLTERSTYVTSRGRANSPDARRKDSDLGSRKTVESCEQVHPDTPIDVGDIALENLKTTEHDYKASRSNSDTSALSDQDIDAMFQSYEADKSEEKEYHGQYGMIKFTVQYDSNTQELLIIIGSCRGLTLGDKGTIPNPFVKAIILPVSRVSAKASKKRTPVMKKTADPVFNFSILYPGISNADLESKGIRLSVMDEASFGNSSTIGETCVPLSGLSTRPVQQFRRILDSRANDEALFLDTKKTESHPGRIELALHYLSKQEKLVVGIIRCVGLKAADPNGYSDPYVKCYLLPDPHRKTKRKTVIKKKTLNPEFHQEFQYDIAHAELAKKTLFISVWDHDSGTTNDFIGALTVGIDSSGDILRHWFETLKTADRRVIRWHTLSENCPIIE